jgi:hypothetical protein
MLAGADDAAGMDVILGIAGTTGLGPTVPAMGETFIVGSAAAELTPRLPTSVDPNGMPVRATPAGVVGDVDVGVEEETMLLEPEPHIPDMPEVSGIPGVVDIPDVAAAPDEIGISEVTAVAGAALPGATPPPSKLELDPNISDGAVPEVEHAVPLPGIEIEPVTPAGVGLTPGDAISVEPRGMPVGETAEPVSKPSGEVAPTVGVGLAIPLTCAMATLQTTSAGTTAAINASLIGILLLAPGSSRQEPVTIRSDFFDVDHGSPIARNLCRRSFCKEVACPPIRSIKYAFILLSPIHSIAFGGEPGGKAFNSNLVF